MLPLQTMTHVHWRTHTEPDSQTVGLLLSVVVAGDVLSHNLGWTVSGDEEVAFAPSYCCSKQKSQSENEPCAVTSCMHIL